LRRLLAALLLGLVTTTPHAADETTSAAFFAATLHSLDDRPFALESLRGKPLIVNFWARWCGPCKAEIPELVATHEAYARRGLTVVGIALDDNLENTRDFARSYDMRYTNLAAKTKGIELMQASGNPKAVVPFTLVIDAAGNVVARKLGALKKTELDAYAKQLLGKH
jgi:thiol-disulfide isomerase/thioredoxin